MIERGTRPTPPAIAPALQGAVRRAPGPDGVPLFYRYWAAPSPRAAAVYLHGIAGHSLWFSAAASRLAASGITVYGPDRRGSGLNLALGAGDVAHHEVVLRDIRHFVELARAECAGRPVYLIAGCWGAKAGAVVAAREQELLAGLVLVAPALCARIKLPIKDLAGVAKSLLKDPTNRFDIPLRPEQYTDNPEFREFIVNDRKRLLQATARFFLETSRLDRLAAAAPESIRLPTVMLLGERDVIIDVPATRAWFNRLASTDKSLHVYPEYAHILEFEPQPAGFRYLFDLLSWFRARVPAETPATAGRRRR